MLEQVRLGPSGGDRPALGQFGPFSRPFRGVFAFQLFALPLPLGGPFAFLLGALPFLFCGALSLALGGQLSLALGGQLSLALGGQLSLALGGALAGLVRGAFLLLPRAFLPGGAFLFPPGGPLALPGMPITFRCAVAGKGVIRPFSAVRRAAVRWWAAIWRHAGGVGIGDRDRP